MAETPEVSASPFGRRKAPQFEAVVAVQAGGRIHSLRASDHRTLDPVYDVTTGPPPSTTRAEHARTLTELPEAVSAYRRVFVTIPPPAPRDSETGGECSKDKRTGSRGQVSHSLELDLTFYSLYNYCQVDSHRIWRRAARRWSGPAGQTEQTRLATRYRHTEISSYFKSKGSRRVYLVPY
ncbi:hypothetical protein J6590_002189 [Homalodisca vitripennis]|nr:hypothetical protein J6590_002189 [Homalodisca vitripennis]